MNLLITETDALEAVIGATPLAMTLKVIDHLDAGALRWIGFSPLAHIAFGGASRVAATLAGGKPGFAVADPRGIRIPVGLLDDPWLAQPGAAFGSLFSLPGVSESLRVNGQVAEVRDDDIHLVVQECYIHCSKALNRSEFWTAKPVAAPQDTAGFIAECRFMALATMDTQGRADLSPKGDPHGAMVRFDGSRLWFSDRPGNRRVDSLRNIVAQPSIAATLLIPGSVHVARLTGEAHITADEVARAKFSVGDNMPALAVWIDDLNIAISESSALVRAGLWPVADRPPGIEPGKIYTEHLKFNEAKRLGA